MSSSSIMSNILQRIRRSRATIVMEAGILNAVWGAKLDAEMEEPTPNRWLFRANATRISQILQVAG
jgi:hypothetical protein